MRNSFPFLVILSAGLFVSGCRKQNALDCFKSNGPEVTETRLVEGFDSLDLHDKIEATIITGAEYKVEIIAGKNIIKNVSAKVHSGTLALRNLNTCNFVRGYKRKIKIKVTTPQLLKVTHYGVASLSFPPEFKQDSLRLRVEGSGDIYINGQFKVLRTSSVANGDLHLAGTADELQMNARGTHMIFAEGMRVKNRITISTHAVGDAHFDLSGLDRFEYSIFEEGNIYYRGQPGSINNFGHNQAKGKLIRVD